MSGSWGPFGQPPISFFQKANLAEIKRMKEIVRKSNDLKKLHNRFELSSKLEALQEEWNRLTNTYEGTQ
jgi:uncharacterized protein YktA (UPF0223 family)|tara:strand:+ start:58 stop:264 length:207 start_codon:yes stop_codon:yes gene_type:complete